MRAPKLLNPRVSSTQYTECSGLSLVIAEGSWPEEAPQSNKWLQRTRYLSGVAMQEIHNECIR